MGSLMNDFLISQYCTDFAERKAMIEPFIGQKVSNNGKHKVLSYGLESAGYGIRLSPKGLYLAKWTGYPIHPLAEHTSDPFVEADDLVDSDEVLGKFITLNPREGLLGVSMEKFNMPRCVKGKVVGKSTLARLFVHPLVTPLEPGWSGYLTIELVNLGPFPVAIPLEQGIAVVEFYLIDFPMNDYSGGKYQDQPDKVVFAK